MSAFVRLRPGKSTHARKQYKCVGNSGTSSSKKRRLERPLDRLLVLVPCRVVFGGIDKTASLFAAAVDNFDNVDEVLLVFNDKVDFVVVAGAEIDHHVLVAPEEHHGAGVVEFVHYKR